MVLGFCGPPLLCCDRRKDNNHPDDFLVHSAYVQLATLLKLVMSAILFLNALFCNMCVSDTPIY